MNHIDGVIDVKDLFAELVRKLWVIILCAVLFAGVLGIYANMKNVQNNNDKGNLESILKEEELDVADKYVASVLEFYNLKDYMDNSIMMTCNPYNIYQTELKYVISGTAEEKDVATIRTSYENYVLYGNLICDIASKDNKYDGKVLLNALTIDVENKVESDSSRVFSVLIYAKDEKQTEELISLVKEQMMAYTSTSANVFEKHKLELLSISTIQVVDDKLIETKDKHEARIEILKAKMENLGAQLSVNQKAYSVEMLKDSLDRNALKDLKIEELVEDSSTISIIKFLILGGAVGLCLAIVYIIALYFFTNQVKSEKELEHIYGISHIGNCSIYKRNIFDKLADYIFYKNKINDLSNSKREIVDALIKICKENQVNELAILNCDDNITAILDEISESLKEADLNCVLIKNVSDRTVEMSKRIVLTGILKHTSMQEIEEAFEVCKVNNITIWGYITFSK